MIAMRRATPAEVVRRLSRRWLGAPAGIVIAILGMTLSGLAAAEERVSFPSFDGSATAPVVLTGFWFPAGNARAPAVALFHGCGGVYERQGVLSRRLRAYAALLNRVGMHALVVDSLTPRYETELCTQRIGRRRVTQKNRRLDALGAVAYLAERRDVDAGRIGLLGWSNGGSTVLAAINLRHPDVGAATVKPAFAVAFYPGCEADSRRPFQASAPLLMMVGEADDWTAAAPCHVLARDAVAPVPEIEGYAGAFHGFDMEQPVRLRKDVPNGVKPGQGVHVGGNPEARRASEARLVDFLAERSKP